MADPIKPVKKATPVKAVAKKAPAKPIEKPVDKPLTAFSPPADVEKYIRKHFPTVAAFLGDAQVKKILFDGAIAGITDPTEIEGLIERTDYWTSHGPASRELDRLINHDPAVVAELINTAKIEIGQAFTKEGVTLDDTTLGEYAKKAIRGGGYGEEIRNGTINPGFLNRFVSGELRKRTTGAAGAGAGLVSADAAVQKAKEYLVPMSRQQAEGFVLDAKDGKIDEAWFENYLRGAAKGRFLGQTDIENAIDRGMTPTALFQSTVNETAKWLEIDPGRIDLMDPRWSNLVEFVDDEGRRRAPTLSEAGKWARKQPEYQDTDNSKRWKAQTTNGLLRFLGMTPGSEVG